MVPSTNRALKKPESRASQCMPLLRAPGRDHVLITLLWMSRGGRTQQLLLCYRVFDVFILLLCSSAHITELSWAVWDLFKTHRVDCNNVERVVKVHKRPNSCESNRGQSRSTRESTTASQQSFNQSGAQMQLTARDHSRQSIAQGHHNNATSLPSHCTNGSST